MSGCQNEPQQIKDGRCTTIRPHSVYIAKAIRMCLHFHLGIVVVDEVGSHDTPSPAHFSPPSTGAMTPTGLCHRPGTGYRQSGCWRPHRAAHPCSSHEYC